MKPDKACLMAYDRRCMCYYSIVIIMLTGVMVYAQKPEQSSKIQEKPRPGFRMLPRFEHLTQEHGLSHNTVTGFTQDKQGFLWIGTFDGLNRYDGKKFKVIRTLNAEQTPLQVRSLYTDRRGDIWVVHFGNTIRRFNPRREYFEDVRFPVISGNPSHDNYVNDFLEDADGMLWMSTLAGLVQYNPTTQTFRHIPHPVTIPRNHTAHKPTSLDPDDGLGGMIMVEVLVNGVKEQRFWIRKPGGLYEFNPKTNQFITYDCFNIEHDEFFFYSDLAQDSFGYFWFPIDNGVCCFNPSTKLLKAVIPEEVYTKQTPASKFAKNSFRIRTTLCTPGGEIWFGSYGGIIVLRHSGNPQSATTTLLQHDEANLASLSGNTIRTLFCDKSGVIWVGGEPFGINKYSPYRQKFALFRHSASNHNSIGNNYVRGIYQSRNGKIWVATHFGGISCYNPFENTWTRYYDDRNAQLPPLHDSKLRLPINEIWAIFEDRTGTLWAGTRGNGLFHFKNGKFHQSDLVPVKSVVQVITEDRAGNLLVGIRSNTAYAGFFQIPPSRNKRLVRHWDINLTKKKDFTSGDVLALHESKGGDLWAGGAGGLVRFVGWSRHDSSTTVHDYTAALMADFPGAISNVGSIVSSITEDHDGTVWVTSKGAGLRKFDRDRDKFTGITTKNGLPNNNVYAMLEDSHSRFWISSDGGLCLWNPAASLFREFSSADGLQGREFNRLSYHKSSDGVLFFGGINGLNMFYPDSVLLNPSAPPVALASFKVFAEEILPDSLMVQNTITLQYHQNFFSMAFAALDFHAPEKNRFSYKLEGVDPDWTGISVQSEAAYTNIDPGSYTLRVRAANSDGVWNPKEFVLKIIIVPPWWKTWQFFFVVGLCSLIGLGLVIQNYRARIFRLQQRRQELLLHIREREQSEKKFRALFMSSPLGMMLWNINGEVLDTNPAFEVITGFNLEALHSVGLLQFFGQNHLEVIRYALQQRSAFGPLELQIDKANGDKISLIITGMLTEDNTPESVRNSLVWTVLEDITERKRATDALLRYQLNPHFMFNVLNSVSALMSENQRNARRMIVEFSRLLRHTLVASTRQMAALGEELQAANHYLAIEKLRYEERLEWRITIEQGVEEIEVPVFLIQPLVENGIKYGMETGGGSVSITIEVKIQSDEQLGRCLCVGVSNSGSWVGITGQGNGTRPSVVKGRSTGIGLENLRRRLGQYYPQGHCITTAAHDGFVLVSVHIALNELVYR